MNKEEKIKYRKMGFDETKDNLKKEWLNYTACNSKSEVDFIKVKLTSICMRRLSNGFTCEQILNFLKNFPITQSQYQEIIENISYFHRFRNEEFYNYKEKLNLK